MELTPIQLIESKLKGFYHDLEKSNKQYDNEEIDEVTHLIHIHFLTKNINLYKSALNTLKLCNEPDIMNGKQTLQ